MKYRITSLEVDTVNFSITESGQAVAIEPKVFDLLVYLINHRQQVVTRDELFEQIWQGREVSDTTLSNHVKSVRKLFGDDGETQSVIKTIRGRGYQFIADVQTIANPTTSFKNAALATSPKRIGSPLTYLVFTAITLLVVFLLSMMTSPDSETNQDRPYVLITPFGVSSGQDEKWQPFADQMTREVIRKLGQLSEIKVIPSSSAFALGEDQSHSRIRETLPDVDFVVEAMVNVNGESDVRVTADMYKVETANILWSEAFYSQITDANYFSVQSDIATTVASSLDLILGDKEKAQLSTFPTSDLKAYELYVTGQQLLNQFTHESLVSAIDYFDKAITRDREFAEAYIAKADAYRIIMSYFAKPSDVLPDVVDAVQQALNKQPDSAEALSSMGLAYALAWRWEEAWTMLSSAREANPQLALTELGFALYYAGIGDVPKLHAALEKANSLDPLNLELADWGHWALAMVGELDSAVAWSQHQLQLHPEVGILYSGASVSASLSGDHRRAISLAQKGIELDPAAPYGYLALAQTYGHAGQTELIQPWLEKATELNSYLCPYETAVAFILLDDIDEAFAHLNNAVTYRSNCLVFTRNDLRLAPIRKDPRFTALLTRIGLGDDTVRSYPR